MNRASRWAIALAALGLALRLASLPAWGTFDVEVQKAWATRAAEDGLADIYGPPDGELMRKARERGGSLALSLLALEVPRTEFRWGTASYFVDYPPGSLLVLWTAGRLYGLASPALENRRGFNAAINLAPLLGSMAIAWLLWKSAGGDLGWRRSLAFWLNPAMLLAAPLLGYQDTILGTAALLAVLAMMRGNHGWATALVVVAGLIKPQGALLLPALVVVLGLEGRPRAWIRAALAALTTAALVLAPWWSSGYLLSALDGCRRPLMQGTLAPLGFNVWWVAGWLMDVAKQGGLTLARIVAIDEFAGWAGFDPRLPARIALTAATLAIAWLLARGLRSDRRLIPLSVILQVHAYALLGTSVHENHTLIAVMLAPLLIGDWDNAGRTLTLTSAFAFASLFLAAGFGRRITRQVDIATMRALTGIDASVLMAVAHVALVALLVVWVARTRPSPAGAGA
jgi:hypothetical protein